MKHTYQAKYTSFVSSFSIIATVLRPSSIIFVFYAVKKNKNFVVQYGLLDFCSLAELIETIK